MSDELDQGFAELMALAQNPKRDGLLPARFYVSPVRDEAKSAAAGRAVFVDKEMVEIRVDRDVLTRPVSDQDKRDYAAQYVAFRQGVDQTAVEGTPLREWPLMTRSQAEEFAYGGLRTVEQFASAADTAIQRIGPYMELRQKARDWLAAAKGNAEFGRLRDENTELKNRVAALERMLETQRTDIEKARQAGGVLPGPNGDDRFKALEAQIAALAETQVARRGRPPGSKNKPKNGADQPKE